MIQEIQERLPANLHVTIDQWLYNYNSTLVTTIEAVKTDDLVLEKWNKKKTFKSIQIVKGKGMTFFHSVSYLDLFDARSEKYRMLMDHYKDDIFLVDDSLIFTTKDDVIDYVIKKLETIK